MKTNTRNACNLDAAKLLNVATENGAISLGVQSRVGKICTGYQADFLSFNLEANRLNGMGKDELLDALIFGCGNEEIRRVFVSGVER
jgi:cytosine/adenosine deaminase-related metal-dependent hydrolase